MLARRSLLGALLATLLCAGTCESQDFFAGRPLVLEDAAPFVSVFNEIEQPYRGRNSLDFSITNDGAEDAQFALFAAIFCDDDLCSERRFADVTEPLQPGVSQIGRLTEQDLGLGQVIHLEFLCWGDGEGGGQPCSGTLEYTLQLREVECQNDTECSSDEFCDVNLTEADERLDGERPGGICRIDTSALDDEGCGCLIRANRALGRETVPAIATVFVLWRLRRRRASKQRQKTR